MIFSQFLGSLKSKQTELVATDTEILNSLNEAFVDCPRPLHFTNWTHCEECKEHDDLLCSRDSSSLSLKDVGNVGWDPICSISPEGFAYYVPALARLAMTKPEQPFDWFGSQLLPHLCYDGPGNNRVLACTPSQRTAVVLFLNHLSETRADLADACYCVDELLEAIKIWSNGQLCGK